MTVGDGVNDAPALIAATAGIAIGGGAEVAMPAVADARLTAPSLDAVLALVKGARRSLGIVRRNLVYALAYNLIFATLAVAGHIDPLMAAVIMPLNSLTLLATSTWSRSFGTPAS